MISYVSIVFIKTNLPMILIKIIIEIIKCDLIRQRVNHSMSIIQIDINKRKSENKQRYTIKGNSRGQGEIIRIHHVTGRTKASVYHLTVPQSRTIRKHMLLMLLEDSIEYKKASQTRKHICKAFTRPKSFQTVVFLDWSRCWKSGSLLCVYPPDDRRRCRPSNECTEPDIENNDTNEEKRTNYKEPEERERKQKGRSFCGGTSSRGPVANLARTGIPSRNLLLAQISLYVYFYPFLIIYRRCCTILSDEGIKRSTAA